MNALELKIPPVALTLATAACMWGMSVAVPGLHIEIPGAAAIAAGLVLVGAAVALLGVLAFRSAGTTVDPRTPNESVQLVVRGVYRFSRNPMYLGFLLLLCAWAAILRNLAGFAFLAAFVIYMNRFQIVPEERFMRTKFGEPYARYARRVRRWI